jgi:hypothetical protein
VDTSERKRRAEPRLPSSGRLALGTLIASALATVATWQRAMLRLFTPLQGARDAHEDPEAQAYYAALLDRRLVGFLITFESGMQGIFAAILTGQTRLGAGDSDIVIPDQHVSMHHASLYVDPDTEQVFVEDDHSRNGTFVNEQRVGPGERRQVRDNDHLRLGVTTFLVKLIALDEGRGVAPVPLPYR